jgi:hydroxylamine reductase
MEMFCFQCEQTAKGEACTRHGVCGKSPEAATLMDLLVHAAKGISQYAQRARRHGAVDAEIDHFVVQALFATVTNVDFDPLRLEALIRRAAEMRDRARELYETAAREAGETPESLDGPADFQPAADREGLLAQGDEVSIEKRRERLGDDVVSLQETAMYGLKGAAAYTDHAHVLGVRDPEHDASFHDGLVFHCREDAGTEELVAWALEAGKVNLRAMELLDKAHTETFGHPEPTQVRIHPKAGKAIVVSGHDLLDLKMLLEQTAGTGINVYTHGEMLPAHGYPELKKHPHLAGNFGGAWQDQQQEFKELPGAILMTTNCLQKPQEEYAGRLFTTGLVAWPEIPHIEADAEGAKDFSPVIEAAQAAPGYQEDGPDSTITVGFGRQAVLNVADKVVEAVKAGAIRHFFLVGGCDGAKSGRNYYTEFVEQVPEDCVVLTLACGKYRFNKMDLGSIDGIPRLLDVGQCNDAYSAIQIALALAEAFDCDVNELPLSMVLSWYEQKAVAILLTLLALGIRDIRLGPSLPAFVSPAVLNTLVSEYNIQPVTTPEEDLRDILEGGA